MGRINLRDQSTGMAQSTELLLRFSLTITICTAGIPAGYKHQSILVAGQVALLEFEYFPFLPHSGRAILRQPLSLLC